MKFTLPQKTAVYYNRGNLLLSAAAGSGKTASLTSRIVRLILDGEAKMDEMLIVTYTRAAASEMRSRIRKKLADAVGEWRREDPVLAARAAEAIRALPSASISTIHSFLYREMRPYFPALGMPWDTRIMDTGTSEKIKSDVMRDVVDDFYSKKGADGERFVRLADIIGQARDTMAIDGELLWLADRLVSFGMREDALRGYAREYEEYGESDGAFFETGMGRVIMDEVRAFTRHYGRVLSDLSAEFEDYPKVMEKYGDTLSYMTEWVGALTRATEAEEIDYGAVRALIASYEPPKLGRLAAKDACHASDKFKFWRDRLKKDLAAMRESYFSAGEDEIKYTACSTAEILGIASDVLGEYFTRLREIKRARGVVDYGDLESMALELFVGEDAETEAAREVGGKFRYVFIDEYQDTNAVQDAIFSALTKESVRFMVGDVKQSIYRFRKADPRVFSHYRRAWRSIEGDEMIEDEEALTPPESVDVGEVGRSLFMSDNFRCDSAIIDFVNMISAHTLAHGGVPYGREDELICSKNGGDTPRAPVEVVMIEKKRASSRDAADSEARSADEADSPQSCVSGNPEAAYVAGRIAAMLGKYSVSGERVVNASDIVIIMRSPGNSAADYERELAAYGIPCYTKQSRKLTDYPSVMLILCLLNFIDNPMRDIYTAGALHSAVFGFSLGELAALRDAAGDMPLYVALCSIACGVAEADAALMEKCARAEARFTRLKTVSRGMSAEHFLEFLIRDTNLYATPGIRASGEERDAISRLIEMARGFEATASFGGISGFIDYVAQSEDEESSAADTSSAVQIMSIHSSKGLEFPIVFLAECGKRRNTADESGTILFDDAVGLGMMLPDEGGLAKCDTVMRRVIARGIARASVEEEMRMLYVALTRAGEHLIVTAKTSDAEAEAVNAAFLAEEAGGYDARRASRYLDWIMEACARHGGADFYTISAMSSTEIRTGRAYDAVGELVCGAEPETPCPITEGELCERFAFAYPREHLAHIPSKLTVSRLYPEILDEDGAAEAATELYAEAEADEVAPRPSFMVGDAVASGAERGSATHVFMQFADFERLCELGATAELERLVVGGFMSRAMADLVNIRQIERFAVSSLVDKMRRSPILKREFRFNVRMPADRFTSDAELKEKLAADGVRLTVQGVVDAVFRDPDTGDLVLVDYKTDRVTDEEWRDPALAAESFRRRHESQLTYYREICSRLFGEEITSALIYSTVLGRTIEI